LQRSNWRQGESNYVFQIQFRVYRLFDARKFSLCVGEFLLQFAGSKGAIASDVDVRHVASVPEMVEVKGRRKRELAARDVVSFQSSSADCNRSVSSVLLLATKER